MTIRKDVWRGADNRIKLLLSGTVGDSCGTSEPIDLINVTSMTMVFDTESLTVNRNDLGGLIDWWDADLEVGEVVFVLGGWVESVALPAAEYPVRLISTDGVNVNGIVWTSEAGRELVITVRD